MPKISLLYQQHRQVIGNHINWQDRRQHDQHYQNDRIQRLANRPGGHAGNRHKQDTAQATLQLLSFLSLVRNRHLDPVMTELRSDELSAHHKMVDIGADHQSKRVDPLHLCEMSCNIRNTVVEKLKLLRLVSRSPLGQGYRNTPNAVKSEESVKDAMCIGMFSGISDVMLSVDYVGNGLQTMLHSVTNVLYKTDQFMLRYDPLRFPETAAFPANSDSYVVNMDNDNLFIKNKEKNLEPVSRPDDVNYGWQEQNFIKIGRQSLKKYYEDYNSKYLALKKLAVFKLKREINTRFQLDINPDKVCFMHFDNTEYDGKGKIHFSPPRENKTLTEWLFTNFSAETQDNIIATESMKEMSPALEIRNRERDFLQVVPPVEEGLLDQQAEINMMQFDPASPSWNWLFDNQIEDNIIQYSPPLDRFLPLQEVSLTFDINKIDYSIKSYVTSILGDHPYDIFYGFTQYYRELPQYIRNARANARVHFEWAKNWLDKARYNLSHLDYEESIKYYLSRALNTQDDRILMEAIARLKMHVERARNFIIESEVKNFENVGIVSTRQVAESSDPLTFKSPISNVENLEKMPMGFIIEKDPLRRVFLMNDAVPLMSLNKYNFIKEQYHFWDSIVLHEISHIASATRDYYYNLFLKSRLRYGNDQILRMEFTKAMENGRLKNTRHFTTFMESVYQHLGINEAFDENVALGMLQRDPMLQANIMMDNADSFVVYVKAIGTYGPRAKSEKAR